MFLPLDFRAERQSRPQWCVMAPQVFTRGLGQARDRNSSALPYQQFQYSQAVTQGETRYYTLLNLDTQLHSSNFHQHSFGQDTARGPHFPHQSHVFWLPEIISCLAGMACIIGEQAYSLSQLFAFMCGIDVVLTQKSCRNHSCPQSM